MDQGDPMAYLLNFGAVGIFLVLWLTGRLMSRPEYDRETERADAWKLQYEREAEAHDVTRQALQRERDRADAGLEAGRTAAAVLSVLGHHAASGGGP